MRNPERQAAGRAVRSSAGRRWSSACSAWCTSRNGSPRGHRHRGTAGAPAARSGSSSGRWRWTCCRPRTSSCRSSCCSSLFGLLVVTATPVYQIPTRLACAPGPAARAVTRHAEEPDADDPADQAHRHCGADARRGSGSARWPGPGRLRPRGRPGVRLTGPGRPRALQASPGQARPQRTGGHRRGRSPTSRRSRPSRRRTPRCRRGSSSWRCPATSPTRCPANEVLKAGQPAQAADQGVRRRGRPADRGARAVRHRRPGHRLHPRPDGHPLRGRARPGGQGREGHRARQEHRLRGGQRRRPHPQPDPRQERDRHRDPEHRQGDRLPRRRPAARATPATTTTR